MQLKVEVFLIWIKRIAPFVVITLVILSILWYNKHKKAEFAHNTDNYALVTAQLWIATAQFRNEPEKYLSFRDSLLTAKNISIKEIEIYLKKYEETPEDYYPFTAQLKKYVDSLYIIADSVLAIKGIKEVDSLSEKINLQ